jgi:hypothetical protein
MLSPAPQAKVRLFFNEHKRVAIYLIIFQNVSDLLICTRLIIFFYFVPIRRLNTEQVMDKEIIALSIAIEAPVGMPCAGKDEQIEILVGFD